MKYVLYICRFLKAKCLRLIVIFISVTFGLLTLNFTFNLMSQQTLIQIFNTTNDHGVNAAVSGNGLEKIKKTFHEVLQHRASQHNTLFLSSVDSGYTDLALNLYFSSFKKLSIDNYLFVGSDSEVCRTMKQYNIACYEYIHDKAANVSSSYYSLDFKRKTHLKTKIIYEALKIGINAIIVDVDIVFLQDPTPFMNCHDCDIEITSDVSEGNSGFYIARPTPNCTKLHSDAWKQGLHQPKISNQKVLNSMMTRLQRRGEIKIRNLDPEMFANGLQYFERGQRMFKLDNPSKTSVIVHNNWIVSSNAKILRFKECGLWYYDDDGYYSDARRKYLMFDLPLDVGKVNTQKLELESLYNALAVGNILNRTVILPQFHCYGCTGHRLCNKKGARCTFSTFYRVTTFDKSFKDKYRESVFLSHPLVPRSVHVSQSEKYIIKSTLIDNNTFNQNEVRVLSPQNIITGPTVSEIMQWFGRETSSILVFHSLYTHLDIHQDYVDQHPTIGDVRNTIKLANYRQY